MLVYTAGKYRGDVDKNIDDAKKVAIDLWEMGYVVICPHLNTDHFENDCKVIDDVYLKGDLEIILRCDAMVMIPGWRDSRDRKSTRLNSSHSQISYAVFCLKK